MISITTQKHQLETFKIIQNLEVKQTAYYFAIQLVISCLIIISCYNMLLLSHGFLVLFVIVQVQRLAQCSRSNKMSSIILLLHDD
jgi:hypothetical protein